MPQDRENPLPDRPLRILVLRGLDGAGGGAEHIILNSAASLDRQQFEMRICCMRREGDPLYDFDQRAAAQKLDYCEVMHTGALDRQLLSKLSRVVDQFGPDLIHSHDYKASFYASRLARRFRTSRLATAHGWTGHTARERWLYYPADKWHLSRYPGVIAVSNEIRRTLLLRGAPPDRVCVVLNAVDLERYERDESVRRSVRAELGLDDSEVVLGAVGRVEPQKRFDLLLQTFAKLHEQRPETRLLIAGEGSQFDQIEQLVAQHGLQSVCRMLGHCPAITRTYHAFDLLVQSSDYEGTPTVVVEAMALGIPIVATKAGGTEQLLQDRIHGRLVPCRDTGALHQAISETLDDPPAAAERATAARRRVEQALSFVQRTRRLERIYRQMVRFGHLSDRRLAEEEARCETDPIAI